MKSTVIFLLCLASAAFAEIKITESGRVIKDGKDLGVVFDAVRNGGVTPEDIKNAAPEGLRDAVNKSLERAAREKLVVPTTGPARTLREEMGAITAAINDQRALIGLDISQQKEAAWVAADVAANVALAALNADVSEQRAAILDQAGRDTLVAKSTYTNACADIEDAAAVESQAIVVPATPTPEQKAAAAEQKAAIMTSMARKKIAAAATLAIKLEEIKTTSDRAARALAKPAEERRAAIEAIRVKSKSEAYARLSAIQVEEFKKLNDSMAEQRAAIRAKGN